MKTPYQLLTMEKGHSINWSKLYVKAEHLNETINLLMCWSIDPFSDLCPFQPLQAWKPWSSCRTCLPLQRQQRNIRVPIQPVNIKTKWLHTKYFSLIKHHWHSVSFLVCRNTAEQEGGWDNSPSPFDLVLLERRLNRLYPERDKDKQVVKFKMFTSLNCTIKYISTSTIKGSLAITF